MTYLLDVNLLVALAWPSHVHHRLAHTWFVKHRRSWATCPLTQLGFARVSANKNAIEYAVTPKQALALLARMTAADGHEFWPDSIEIIPTLTALNVVGHQQLTDAYLLSLAAKHSGKLATLDRSLENLSLAGAASGLELLLRG